MRWTIELDEDVARAVDAFRSEIGLSMSEAVNELIRRGLRPAVDAKPFRQATAPLGLRIDVSRVAEALAGLSDPPAS